jgi:starch-binding outer membrane protein, SusD/RagB family
MKKYIIISLLFLSSCTGFLEPKSQTEYVPRDANSLNELLIGNAYIDPNNQSAPVFSYNEIFSDDWMFTSENCVHTNNLSQYPKYKALFAWHPDMFKISSENNNYQNVWRYSYERILGCNSALDYIDKMIGTDEEKSYVKGQALALRAFYYFNLVNLFGEPYYYNKKALGVPLKLNSNLELTFASRSTVEDVYAQIIKDLDDAEEHFLKMSVSKHFVKNGRITLPMIQLMKARVALFTEDYDNVIKYSKRVIEDWGLALLDLNSFTSTSAAPYYSFTSHNNPEAIWLFGNSLDLSRFFSESLYLIPTSTSQRRRMFNASPSLLSLYDVNDLRKNNYIIKESTSIANYSVAAKIPVSTTYAPVTTMFGRALRLSEAYLMLAEASYLKSDFTTAVNSIETLRRNRFKSTSGNAYKIPSASTSGPGLLTFIKEERRREMCFEGLRWFDLRRWGMESFSRDWKEEGVVMATFTIEKNDPAYTLPIPFDAIEKNPNLIQNRLSTPKY